MNLGSLGLPEIILIVVIVLLLFGPKRLPDLARSLGESIREFKKAMQNAMEEPPIEHAAAKPVHEKPTE